MRIALFHDFLVRLGGAEHVLFTLAGMFPEADIYTLFADKEAVEKRYPGAKVHVHPGAQKAFKRVKRLPKLGRQVTKVLLPWYPRWVEEMDFSAYDLVIVSSTAWALGLITPVDTPVVAYVHSPARFLWDYYPQYKKELGARSLTGWKNTLLTRYLSKFRLWNKLAGERAEHLLCNSKLVQERIEKFYRRDDATVLYPPVDVGGLQCTGATPQGHVLLIATLTPYKNIDAILAWWKTRPEKLLIVGDGPDRKRLESLSSNNVEFLGYVSHAKRNQLIETARCMLYPSKEDFGIVPIEAMAAGKLPLALGQGGVVETIHDGKTGILYPDTSLDSLQAAWERFEQLEKHYHPASLRKEAEQYDTKAFSTAFMAYLKEHNLLKS